MSRFSRIFSVALLVTAVFMTGCQKKTTKVEPTTEPPPAEKTEPTPPPPPTDEFKPLEDVDAQLRNLLQPIYFDFDRYDLKSEEISKLERIANYMKENSNVRVLAQGNADERGSSEYNVGLGENRARAVKNYLTSYGISGDRVETTSFGEERPAQPNCGEDDACHQQNRRVEWQVLAK